MGHRSPKPIYPEGVTSTRLSPSGISSAPVAADVSRRCREECQISSISFQQALYRNLTLADVGECLR